MAVKLHLGKEIGRRNADERAGGDRHGDPDHGALVHAEHPQESHETEGPRGNDEGIGDVDEPSHAGGYAGGDHERGDQCRVDRLVQHDGQERGEPGQGAAAVRGIGPHRRRQGGAVGEAVQRESDERAAPRPPTRATRCGGMTAGLAVGVGPRLVSAPRTVVLVPVMGPFDHLMGMAVKRPLEQEHREESDDRPAGG